MKYLSEITDVNKIDHELFNDFMESIGLSDEAVEEINRLIEENNKQIKKLLPHDNINNVTIDDVGDWNIEGDNL